METLKAAFIYMGENFDKILTLTIEHLFLSLYGVIFAAIVGIPVGIMIAKYSRLSGLVISLTNLLQTIPSLAMLAILLVFMGLGGTTVVVSLFLYSLLPIVRNTYIGIKNVESSLVEAGLGVGMTNFQILRMVQIPVALSVMIAGVRVAMVISIGIATIGVFIGGGGLGEIIVVGISTIRDEVVLAGAVPTALLAILADSILYVIEKYISPVKLDEVG